MPVSPLSPVARTPVTVPASVRPPVRGSMREMRPGRSEIQIIESGPHSMSHGVSRPPATIVTVKSSAFVAALVVAHEARVAVASNSDPEDAGRRGGAALYPEWGL